LSRSFVPGRERRSFRLYLRRTPRLGLPRRWLIEGQRLGGGSEAGKQGRARCHDQKRVAVARFNEMNARQMGLMHECPPWYLWSMLRGLVAPGHKRFDRRKQ